MSDVLVLAYHGLSADWPAVTAVTPDAFAEQIHHLRARGYRGATFTAAVTGRAARPTVAVTFDDAHASVYELARPVLDEVGWPATVFVPTDYPTSGAPLGWSGNDHWVGGPFEHELAVMTWDQIEELAGAGWEMGSHTCSHPHLTEIPADEVARELAESREVLERRLGRCDSVAYPYGDVNDAVAAQAGATGYRAGAAAPGGFGRMLEMRWPRVVVDRTHVGERFRLRADPRVRWLLSRPAVAGARRQLARAQRS